jgi:hypothetical protein
MLLLLLYYLIYGVLAPFVLLLPTFLLRRKGLKGMPTKIFVGLNVVLTLLLYWVFFVIPVAYDGFGRCLPPADLLVARGADGVDVSCDLWD